MQQLNCIAELFFVKTLFLLKHLREDQTYCIKHQMTEPRR
jgi:hypothetical protein